MINLFSLSYTEVLDWLLTHDESKFRADQIFQWLYKKHVLQLEDMSNLSVALKSNLSNFFTLALPIVINTIQSEDGTIKYLLQLEDDQTIEMVWIPGEAKNTLCISSQVGCARNCSFCATAALKLHRNLSPDEIVGQVLVAIRLHPNQKLTNIVFMGMGEPLDNLPNVLKSIQILQDNKGISFSPRKMTLSTCGIIPGILALAESGVKIKLAVSLHSAQQTVRETIMPIAKQYPLQELKKALLTFSRQNPFRITFEYVMIKDLNMGEADFKALRSYLGDLPCKLNLIKWNTVPNLPYQTPSDEEIERFNDSLQRLSCAVTFRKSRGSEISAACGQLAAKINNQ